MLSICFTSESDIEGFPCFSANEIAAVISGRYWRQTLKLWRNTVAGYQRQLAESATERFGNARNTFLSIVTSFVLSLVASAMNEPSVRLRLPDRLLPRHAAQHSSSACALVTGASQVRFRHT